MCCCATGVRSVSRAPRSRTELSGDDLLMLTPGVTGLIDTCGTAGDTDLLYIAPKFFRQPARRTTPLPAAHVAARRRRHAVPAPRRRTGRVAPANPRTHRPTAAKRTDLPREHAAPPLRSAAAPDHRPGEPDQRQRARQRQACRRDIPQFQAAAGRALQGTPYHRVLCAATPHLGDVPRPDRPPDHRTDRPRHRSPNCSVPTRKKLLECTDLDIKEIADTLGFSDQSVFGKFFLRRTGTSPSGFRAANGAERPEHRQTTCPAGGKPQ